MAINTLLDNFNRGTLGSDYTVVEGSPSIISNQLAFGSGGGYIYRNADTFGPDCGAHIETPTHQANAFIAIGVRISNTGNGYDFWIGEYDGDWYCGIGRYDSSSWGDLTEVELGSGLTVQAIRIIADGSNLTGYYYNGSSWIEATSTTDSTYNNSGHISLEANTSTARMDNLHGGDIEEDPPAGFNPAWTSNSNQVIT